MARKVNRTSYQTNTVQGDCSREVVVSLVRTAKVLTYLPNMGHHKENDMQYLEPLYDPELLKRLDFSQTTTAFDPPITVSHPGESLLVRPLCPADYDKGFIQLLGQLTKVGDVSREQFLERFAAMKACPNTYYVTVIEDTQTGQIVGCATLVVEQKFIHKCAVRGRLEDVVVSDDYRGKQLGKLIITTITLLAQHLLCYKITLDCKDKMIPFYTGLGYCLEPGSSNYMQIRFEKS